MNMEHLLNALYRLETIYRQILYQIDNNHQYRDDFFGNRWNYYISLIQHKLLHTPCFDEISCRYSLYSHINLDIIAGSAHGFIANIDTWTLEKDLICCLIKRGMWYKLADHLHDCRASYICNLLQSIAKEDADSLAEKVLLAEMWQFRNYHGLFQTICYFDSVKNSSLSSFARSVYLKLGINNILYVIHSEISVIKMLAELQELWQYYPGCESILDLTDIPLERYTLETLDTFFKYIPTLITTIKLSNNNLQENSSSSDALSFARLLLKTRKHIVFGDSRFEKNVETTLNELRGYNRFVLATAKLSVEAYPNDKPYIYFGENVRRRIVRDKLMPTGSPKHPLGELKVIHYIRQSLFGHSSSKEHQGTETFYSLDTHRISICEI